MEDEIWKMVRTTPDLEVSSLGRVRRSETGSICSPNARSAKHPYQRLTFQGRTVYVHRLVCEAFHGPSPFPGAEVDHKNKIVTDNRHENLRWVCKESNLSNRSFRRGEDHSNSKLTEEMVRKIKGVETANLSSAKAARIFGVSRETVRDVRAGKCWRHINV